MARPSVQRVVARIPTPPNGWTSPDELSSRLRRRRTPRPQPRPGTLLLAAGVSSKVVSERLGQAHPDLTMHTYQHLLPGMGATAANWFSCLQQLPGNNTVAEPRMSCCNTQCAVLGVHPPHRLLHSRDVALRPTDYNPPPPRTTSSRTVQADRNENIVGRLTPESLWPPASPRGSNVMGHKVPMP